MSKNLSLKTLLNLQTKKEIPIHFYIYIDVCDPIDRRSYRKEKFLRILSSLITTKKPLFYTHTHTHRRKEE